MATHEQPLTSTPSFELPVIPTRRMTEEEFVAWSFGEEINSEWVAGEVIVMSPISTEYDRVHNWLIALLTVFIEQRDLGSVHGSELQVRFAHIPSRRQPDILFLSKTHCDRLRKTYVEGPPDMIMEIVSPESLARDWRVKYLEYEAAGVSEYWVIDPMAQRVELYVLSGDKKYEPVAERDGWLISAAISGFRIRPEWLWPEARPKVTDALQELSVAGA
jgi:Uma2 family endonuclease